MKGFIMVIMVLMMFIISSCSYYGKVDENGERITNFENKTQQENVVENDNTEEKQEDISKEIENIVEQEENKQQEVIKQDPVKESKTETIKQESNSSKTNINKETKQKQEKPKVEETKVTISTNNNNTKENTEVNTNKNESTNNIPKCSHSNTNWYSSKAEAEAIYNAEIKKWGDKWTNYEIDNDTYYKNCPDGYEVFSCPYCEKWTINLYY